MFYGLLKLVRTECERSLSNGKHGKEYAAALRELVRALNRVMQFN